MNRIEKYNMVNKLYTHIVDILTGSVDALFDSYAKRNEDIWTASNKQYNTADGHATLSRISSKYLACSIKVSL